MLHYILTTKKKKPTKYSITKHFKHGCKTKFLPLTFQLTFASVP